ncbi:MAG TPA: ABC transporter permease [Thermoanaerobaculia bacterium]|nr:ABC transporter permease [Thermoanaerobaculia bacterium]
MTEGARRPLRLALTLPGTLWLALFLAIPGLLLCGLAFLSRGAHGEIVWQLSLGNFQRLLGFSSFGWTADYLRILVRSVVVAGVTTVVALALAYPVAFFVASRPPRRRSFWLALVLIPFATNLVIRTYGWMLILAPALPPARLARWLGLIDPQGGLFPGAFATYVGLISAALPFAVLPLYTNVERLDPALLEAARDLYAPGWRVFRRVIVPLTLPGLTTAAFLTFVPTLGMFVVPDLLGGARYWLIGNVIQQQFGASRDWPFGAALGLALVVLTLAAWWIVRKKGSAGSLA